MPAPQPTQMQQLARLKFTSFNLKVPQNWNPPQGEDAQLYADAFEPAERNTAPGFPPLFQAASMNKYHTDSQKMHIAKIGKFIDDTCDAICSAWSQWQSMASMVGILINAMTAAGGQIVGPPWQPLILLKAPKASPQEMKFSNAIATVISNSWMQFTATVKVPMLPWYPAFTAFPGPVAPPMPNTPVPFALLTQVPVPISTDVMKPQMIMQLGDPMAPFHAELFEAVCDAFEKCYNLWKTTTMVTNVMGMGAIPSFTPLTPAGPVVAGVGNMAPGGFV